MAKIDTSLAVRTIVAAASAVVNLVSTRIYNGLLAESYDLATKPPAIVIGDRSFEDATNGLWTEGVVTFEIWGGSTEAVQEVEAKLADYLHGLGPTAVGSYFVMWTDHEETGEPLPDPDHPGLWQLDLVYRMALRRN